MEPSAPRTAFGRGAFAGEVGLGPCGPCDSRGLLCVVLLSLLVRLAVLMPVLKGGTPAKFDAQSYFRRSVALVAVAEDLARFRRPNPDDIGAVYDRGTQPPFHPAWLALGMLFFGPTVAVARIMTLLLSVGTTALVYLIAARMAGPRAGTWAGVVHAVYPSFLAFSHLLWSESTYIFLLLLAVHLALLVQGLPPSRKHTWLSIALGATLGAMAQTRAAALPVIVVILLWVLIRSSTARAKVLGGAIIAGTLLLTLAPWEYALLRREGRFVALSTFTYRNLFLGNNPWIEAGEEAPGGESDTDNPLRSLRVYAKERGLPIERAARDIAFGRILSDPGRALVAGLEEFLYLWTYDFFTYRHVVNAAYPPVSAAAALTWLAVFVAAALAFYLLVLKGVLLRAARPDIKVFLGILVLSGALPYVLAFGNTRFNLPQMALLVPFAGAGCAGLRRRTRGYAALSILAALFFLGLFHRSYPSHFFTELRPSHHYRRTMAVLDRLHGTESVFADAFTVMFSEEAEPYPLTVILAGEPGSDYSFSASETLTNKSLFADGTSTSGTAVFKVYSRGPASPLRIILRAEASGLEVPFEPVVPGAWNVYRETGLPSLSIMWRGGV